MGWADTAPTAQELQGGSGWDAAPPTAEELKAATPMSVEGFGQNVVEDVKDNAKGLWNLAGNFVQHPVDTTVNTIKNTPDALINEGKRLGIGTLLQGHPIDALKQFGQAAYDKPLTTGMEVIPAVAGVAKGFGAASEAARGASMAEDAANVARGAAKVPGAAEAVKASISGEAGMEGANLAEEAGTQAEDMARRAAPEKIGIGDEGAAETSRGTSGPPNQEMPFTDADKPGAGDAPAKNPLDEVKSYIGNKYGQAASKAGWSDTVADYLDRYSQNFGAKNIGGSPGQVRQMGADAARAIGKRANELGWNKPSVGEIGLTEKVNNFAKEAGQRIGAFRKMADDLRNPVENPIDVLQDVRSKLDQKYLSGRGVNASKAGAYQRAIEMIEDAEPGHQSFADVATELNKEATKASRMKQDPGAFSDVANALSESNNRHIAQVLGPEKAAQYEQALKDFGFGKSAQKMHAFKEGRDVAGRMGPGSMTRVGFQKFMDEVGYKYGSEVMQRMSKAIRKSPDIAKDLPSMFKELHNQIGDVSDEIIPEQFAQGGIVGEVHEYLSSKYDKRR